MKKLIAITLILTLVSCNSEYVIQNDSMYYRFWGFGQGGWNEWQ